MESKIMMDEAVDNKDRRFGSTNTYFPCMVKNQDGTTSNALFTIDQIITAVARANMNPEDIPEDKRSWLEKIFFG